MVSMSTEALCVPHICSPLKVTVVSWTKSQYKYLQNLELATPPTEVNKVEVLVGLDYYFSIVSGKTLRDHKEAQLQLKVYWGGSFVVEDDAIEKQQSYYQSDVY